MRSSRPRARLAPACQSPWTQHTSAARGGNSCTRQPARKRRKLAQGKGVQVGDGNDSESEEEELEEDGMEDESITGRDNGPAAKLVEGGKVVKEKEESGTGSSRTMSPAPFCRSGAPSPSGSEQTDCEPIVRQERKYPAALARFLEEKSQAMSPEARGKMMNVFQETVAEWLGQSK
ncbi:hypothetical protein BDZ91DRAFT_768073 [Kalaharituber pfeilii]|nr:hypothetical protein BDZ91DRAFT_768073 [Kalaharituber pfeilii]